MGFGEPSFDTFGTLNSQATTLTESNMDQWLGLQGDVYDNAQMGAYSANGEPWWQSLIQYGAVRAIDNRYGPVNVGGNTAAGSFAGANGRTYGNAGTNTAGRTVAGSAGGDNSLLLLLLIGAAVYAIAS